MRGRSPNLCVVLAAIAATGLVIAAAPAAQGGESAGDHFEFGFDFTWSDFCGTGADVDVSASYRGTEFLDPNQPVDERVKLKGKTFYVNPLNGKTVLHIAGTMFTTAVSGEPRGLRIVESTTKGLASSLRADRGGLLIRDAGLITVRDWPAFCGAVTDVLGLS